MESFSWATANLLWLALFLVVNSFHVPNLASSFEMGEPGSQSSRARERVVPTHGGSIGEIWRAQGEAQRRLARTWTPPFSPGRCGACGRASSGLAMQCKQRLGHFSRTWPSVEGLLRQARIDAKKRSTPTLRLQHLAWPCFGLS